MRLARDLRVREHHVIQLIAEVFNAPNRLNVTSVNKTYGPGTTPNATSDTATAAETARQFQLAVRYTH